MVAWYIARSLEVLRAQLNARAPRRSTASDGGIGDANHSARTSDHNPNDYVIGGEHQVCARDFTNDPLGGLDCAWLARALRDRRDPRIKYVIWNRAIMAGNAGPSPWLWRPYSGVNPHTKHLHLSVRSGAVGDNTTPWNLDSMEEDMQADERAALFALNDALVKPHQTKVPGSDRAFSTEEFVRYNNANLYNFATKTFPDLASDVAELASEVAALQETCAAILAKLEVERPEPDAENLG